MENIEYIPGQRWVSNTESELGLGLVLENSGRLITISFPAAGERRIYTVENAPLSRVIYTVGDEIRSDEGVTMTVTERFEDEGLYSYQGTDQQGNTQQFDELELDSFVQFNKPQDRLFSGQVDKISSFQLRLETLGNLRRHQQSPAYGLLGPRVQLLPHQFYIANQVAQRYAPRVLLADEVGLGKTIEAGLILHQQIISGLASRVLIVVPDSLVHQWLVEMLRRFNLFFTILDEDRCAALNETEIDSDSEFEADSEPETDLNVEDINPFESAQLVLCSLSFLQDNKQQYEQALTADWDLLVVDEAHHLEWHADETPQASPAYQCIEGLAREIPGLLLLTATPEQLGVESHFARLRLLDPDRYYDLQVFSEEQGSYIAISDLIQQLQDQLSQDETTKVAFKDSSDLLVQIESYLGKETVDELLVHENPEKAINDCIDSLLDRHGTGRVLFRNTRDAVQGFPERQLHSYPLAIPRAFSEESKHVDLESWLHPERILGEYWLTNDPRVEWLTDWLIAHREEKVLLICAKADMAQSLEKHLRLRGGLRSAVFHEGLSLVARDRAAAYFGEEEEDSAQVLICSEIGSEGRNFQFSHHLVMFDLPLNPDLLEQRIGRLDRIGQTETVQIHVPHYENSPQAGLLRWYHEGINAFESVCPIGTTLFQQFGDTLKATLLNDDESALTALINQSQSVADELSETLEKGRNKLLELSSCHPLRATQVIDSVTHSTSPLELASYMERVFDHFGVEQQAHSMHAIVLHPGDHMICHHFPGLSEDGMTATFQRTQALVREDMHFLTWEHPLVTGAMDMMLSGEFGNTAFCTMKNSSLTPGLLILEAVFTLHCPAPKKLQLHRYLPVTVVRVVVDSKKRDLGQALTEEKFNKMAQRVPLRTVHDLVKHARPQISELVTSSEKLASKQRQGLIDKAMQQMMQMQQSEIHRLEALAAVNPNIRSEEIEYLKTSHQQLQILLEGASLKLDAIRVALAT